MRDAPRREDDAVALAHGTTADPPSEAQRRGSRPINPAPLSLLMLVSMVQPTAMNMYLPAMAAMRIDLQTSASAIQVTLSAFLAATALGQLAIGPISDLVGRRPVLVGGMALFLFGTLVCALAPTVEVLIVGRVLQAVGGCSGIALARAIVRDVHGARASASMIGYVTMGMAVAPMVTPALGGLIYEWSSWRYIFLAMGLLGAAALVATWVRLHETHPAVAVHGVLRRFWGELGELARTPTFWRFAMTLALLSVSFFAFIAGGAFVAVNVFGLSASQYGLLFVFVVSGYLTGNFVTGRFGERIGLVRMIVIGNVTSLAGVLLAVALAIFGPAHPLTLFGPMLIVGLGNGFALPNAFAGCVSVRPELAGTASGFAGCFQVGSGAITSIIVGLMLDAHFFPGTSWPVLLPMLLGAVTALAVGLTLRERMLAA